MSVALTQRVIRQTLEAVETFLDDFFAYACHFRQVRIRNVMVTIGRPRERETGVFAGHEARTNGKRITPI